MTPHQRWPNALWIVRHGESAGNLARDRAHAARSAVIDIAERDVDVPLSALGEQQAASLGRWFADMPAERRPNVVLCSPYLRARRTAEIVRDTGGVDPACEDFTIDERLREKEFGVVDRLTTFGIRERLPGEAKRRADLGKFYYRPPGGESWCDVILRLRSALDTISLHHAGERVLIVAHQVVVLCLRYLIEGMTEEQILAIDRTGDVANCSVTSYHFDPAATGRGAGRGGRLVLDRYNFVAPLEAEETPVTAEPDRPVATR